MVKFSPSILTADFVHLGEALTELDNAKTALDVNIKAYNNKLENTVMRSPINGVVTARNYDDGDMSGAAPILVVEQIAPVKMKINVSEPHYAKINKKTEAIAQFEAYGEEKFPATVSIVYPTINAATHTFPVELKIGNKERRVRPGMYGRVTVNFGTKSHVVVPDQAVIKQLGSGDYFVYVYNGGKVSYNAAFPALIFNEIIIEKTKDFVSVDITAVCVDNPKTVTVTIHSNTKVITTIYNLIAKSEKTSFRWSRHNATKICIFVDIYCVDSASRCVENYK